MQLTCASDLTPRLSWASEPSTPHPQDVQTMQGFAYVNRSVIAYILGLHLWPKSRDGKRIGLAMTVFTFLALGLPGLFVIESPEPTPTSWMAELNRTKENKIWSLATGERLRFASIAYLVIGHIAFI